MLKVAAKEPGRSERIKAEAWLKVPQVVGKLSELMLTWTERSEESSCGYK
jgi:hypothetical protein